MAERYLWYSDCECGGRGELENRDPLPGLYYGILCQGCNRVLLGHIPGKTKYRRKATEKIKLEILHIFRETLPQMTVRQIYYALTVRNAVDKTQKGYRQTCAILKNMRLEGSIPYGWIADNTRWMVKPKTYAGLESALELMQENYRRDLWLRQPENVEIWVEKDALAGVISPITRRYDVPLYVARGYGSITFIHDAAESIKQSGKLTYIYHFGDFDPSGVDAANKIEAGLREHGADIFFKRAAITPSQIINYKLPTRETKKKDPRAAKWGDVPSVELDALPADILRKLVTDCIERHVDHDALEWTRRIEEREKATLEAVRQNYV